MNRLRGLRLAEGMTQAELARAIGTTQSHVSEYESGIRRIATMPAGQFVRLKAVLGASDALLLGSGPPPDRSPVEAAENRVARLRRRLRRKRDRASFDLLVNAELDLARRMDECEAAVSGVTG